MGSKEDDGKCKATVEAATNDKTKTIIGENFDTDYTTNVPYTATRGTRDRYIPSL